MGPAVAGPTLRGAVPTLVGLPGQARYGGATARRYHIQSGHQRCCWLNTCRLPATTGPGLQYPFVFYLVFAAQTLLLILVAVLARRLATPFLLIGVWALLLDVSAILEYLVAQSSGQNWWLGWFSAPAEVAVTFGLLSFWERGRVRSAYRAAVLLVPAVTAAVLLAGDATYLFEVWVYPLLSMVMFCAILHTLIICALAANGPLTRDERFWVCMGLSFFWVGFVPLGPFAYALIEMRMEWIVLAYIVRAWIKLAGLLMATYAVLLAWSKHR